MDRSYIINYIAKKINAKTYLEIGVDNGNVFRSIDIKHKVGVDPVPTSSDIIPKTSDEFFKTNTETFDLIFVDGLHEREQCRIDIQNSLKVLNSGGYILIHDTLPFTESMQYGTLQPGMWTGDVWKSIVDIRSMYDDVEVYCIDVDFGLGLITRGEGKKFKTTKELNYNNYLFNRKEWLNMISLAEFYEKFGETDILQSLLNHYIQFPERPEINFNLGVHYHDIGQTASAVSYYIRCAERTHDDLLKYEALLRASMCFNSQGSRGNSVKGMIQHAITLQPHRPEGYFYLSRFYEQTSQWFDGYLMASLGEKVAYRDNPPLKTKLDYPGFYGILFEKAVTSWWTGLCGEARELFIELSTKYPLDKTHKNAVKNNFEFLGLVKSPEYFVSFLKSIPQEIECSERDLNLYKRKDYNKLKHKFLSSSKITRNYSEAYQDMFVLSMLNGKRGGTFVEIGGGFPLYGNNTYLLETQYDWDGVSVDIELESTERFFQDRKCKAVNYDATQINYSYLFKESQLPKVIDYLQLDCDPPNITFEILNRIPFDEYKFGVITYEHDSYKESDRDYKKLSREYLKSKGYELVVSNVCSKEGQDFEDWYVHPELIDSKIVHKIKNISDTKKLPKDIFYK